MCVCDTLCARTRGKGRPPPPAPGWQPCRTSSQVRGWRDAGCGQDAGGVSSAKAHRPLGTKKGNLQGRRGGPSTDLSPTGPCGGGAGGRGREPPGTPPEIWAVAAQGRGGAWTLRPQSTHRLDRELEPSGCQGSGLQTLSLITPRSDCPALPFRSQEPSWTGVRVYARSPDSVWKGLDSSLKEKNPATICWRPGWGGGGVGWRRVEKRETFLRPRSELPVKNRNHSLRSAGGSCGPRRSKFPRNTSDTKL